MSTAADATSALVTVSVSAAAFRSLVVIGSLDANGRTARQARVLLRV